MLGTEVIDMGRAELVAKIRKAAASIKENITRGGISHVRVGRVWMDGETFNSLPKDQKELDKRLKELQEKGS